MCSVLSYKMVIMIFSEDNRSYLEFRYVCGCIGRNITSNMLKSDIFQICGYWVLLGKWFWPHVLQKTFMGTFRMNYVNQIWLRESHEVNFVSRSYFAIRMASAPTAMLLLLLLIKSNCLKIQLHWQKLEKSKLKKEKNDPQVPAIAWQI